MLKDVRITVSQSLELANCNSEDSTDWGCSLGHCLPRLDLSPRLEPLGDLALSASLAHLHCSDYLCHRCYAVRVGNSGCEASNSMRLGEMHAKNHGRAHWGHSHLEAMVCFANRPK